MYLKKIGVRWLSHREITCISVCKLNFSNYYECKRQTKIQFSPKLITHNDGW